MIPVPAVVEEWKWENPIWSHDGLMCTGETYTSAVKMTFPFGARERANAREHYWQTKLA